MIYGNASNVPKSAEAFPVSNGV